MDQPWEARLLGFLDDLEQQASAAFSAEREVEVLGRAQAEYGRIDLPARLHASVGSPLQVTVEGAGTLTGRLGRVASGWFLLAAPAGTWVVRLPAVLAVRGAVPRAVPSEAWPATAKLGFGSILRRLAGETCVLHLRDGGRLEARLGRVGADFVEAYAAEPVLVPHEAIAAVQQRA